jgi:hypothetical protein
VFYRGFSSVTLWQICNFCSYNYSSLTDVFSMLAWRLTPAVLLLSVLGCNDSTDGGESRVAELRLLSSPTIAGTPGWRVPDSVVVKALDDEGHPVAGIQVDRMGGAGVLDQASTTTDAAGRLAAVWTLGFEEGEQTLTLTAGDVSAVPVVATATTLHAEQVTVGGGFACGLHLGTAYCWGDNSFGQLGNGTQTQELVLVPRSVSGDLIFTALSAGGGHVCGLVNASAYCWGSNASGETGTGSAGASISLPTPVATAVRFTQISAEGRDGLDNYTCGVTAQGEAWCWGDNSWGKLGNGTQVNSAVPVRVQSDLTFRSVETGYFHTCALTDTDALWCWGEQETDGGGLGPRPKGFYTLPVPVAEGYRFKDVSLGRDWTCGLTLENHAWCWGSNNSGELGVEIERSAEPVPVSGGLEFEWLSAGSMEQNYALGLGRTLYRWGSLGNDARQIEPVPVTSSFLFVSVDVGDYPLERAAGGSCGVNNRGAVFCTDDAGLKLRGVPRPTGQ